MSSKLPSIDADAANEKLLTPFAKTGVAAPAILATGEGWLAHVSLAEPLIRTMLPLAEREYVNQCRWSPDGKKIVTVRQVTPELNQNADSREIVLTDLEGGHRERIYKDSGGHLDLVFLDWR